jgi:hypothetical protein
VKDRELEKLVVEYADIFVESLESGVGEAKVPEVEILVDSNVKASYQRNYPMSEDEKLTIEQEVEKMLENGVIEPVEPTSTQKGWNSPVLLVKKKNGANRFCIDFRKLNAATFKDNAPLPRITELVEGAAKASVFSKLDLASGYWQIPVEKGSRAYLAFESTRRQYQFKVMPFGISNAPAIFQRMINRLVEDIEGVSAYIDDIVIYSVDMKSHVKVLRKVFERLKKYGLKVNQKKCELGMGSMEVFGFTVKSGTITPSRSRTKALEDLKIPTNAQELQSFLGMIGYYRRFIRNYADHEATLRKSIKEWNWSKECEKAYRSLITEVCALPTLYPCCHDAEAIEVHTDASNVAVGAVLVQIRKEAKEGLPVAFYSKMLNQAGKNYSTTEKELLAVYEALMHFRSYVSGRHVKIKTDHKPLIGILSTKKSPFGPRWSRRLFQLSEFDFEVEYIEGKKNIVPDILSRMVNAISVKWETLEEAQHYDREVQKILEEDGSVIVDKGIVWKIKKDGQQVIVLPRAFQLQAIREAHLGGHFGVKKTLHKLKSQYFWRGITQDVQKYVGSCSNCLKSYRKKQKASEAEHIEKGAIWETLATDHVGPFVTNLQGQKKHILMVIDMFTKYVEAKVVKSTSAQEVCQVLKSLFLRHGCPRSILADNGSGFVAEAVKQTYKELGVVGKHSTPYNPQGNGIVERVNRTIKEGIRKNINSELDVEDVLEGVIFAYNTTRHEATGYSPFFMMYHREPVMPLKSVLLPEGQKMTSQESIEEGLSAKLRSEMEANQKIAVQEWKQDAFLEDKKKVDPRRQFVVGDLAWIYDENASRSFQSSFKGPVRVVARTGSNTYLIDQDGVIRQVNVRRLTKYAKKDHPFEVQITEETRDRMEGNLEGQGKRRERYLKKGKKVELNPTGVEDPVVWLEQTMLPEGNIEVGEVEVSNVEPPRRRWNLESILANEQIPVERRTIAQHCLDYWKSYDPEQGKPKAKKATAVRDAVEAMWGNGREILINEVTKNLDPDETVEDRMDSLAEALMVGVEVEGEGM